MKPHESLSEQAYRAIKDDIVSGVHATGERLSLDRLAEEYQVSKTPIRDALNALQHEGLVEVVPRVGYFVSQMSLEDIQDIFDLRVIIEGAAAELAAQHITEKELRDLQSVHGNYTPGDVDSYRQYLQQCREFHCKVADATRNRRLADVVERVLDQLQRLISLRLDLRPSSARMVEEHRQLIAALRERDGGLARKLTVASIEHARNAVLEAIMRGARLPIHLSK